MEFNFGNQHIINNEQDMKNTDLPIIEVRYIKELDVYYVLHNTGNTSIKLYDTPDQEEAHEMATSITSVYDSAYRDGLGYALFDINAANELYNEITSHDKNPF